MRKDLLIKLVSAMTDLLVDKLLGIETQCLFFFLTVEQ